MKTSERQAWRRKQRLARKKWVDTLSAGERVDLETQLCATVVPHLGHAGILGGYAAAGSEPDVMPILRAAAEKGWRIALPRATRNRPLDFHLIDIAAPELDIGGLGIAEPSASAPFVWPDVLLVPLVAVDKAGNRMGQGGGHYDRTLAKLRSAGRVLAIGIAWDVQLVEKVAAESWDQQVDAIATPAGFHLTGAGGVFAR